jgi:hypothetical protein
VDTTTATVPLALRRDLDECPLCQERGDREYGPRMLASLAESDRMLADPSLEKSYTDVSKMMADLLAE